jgi:LPS-assembly protein
MANAPRPPSGRRRLCAGAACLCAVLLGGTVDSQAQFPSVPGGPSGAPGSTLLSAPPGSSNGQMLVQAREINYDYSGQRVSAVGNVQIYYGKSTVQADKVI